MAKERLAKFLHQLCANDAVAGAVVLSTCNRTEVYLDAERFHDSYRAARDALADQADFDPDQVAPHLGIFYDIEAVDHLFAVAAGLDSAVLGEHEILGQVREAWDRARQEGTVTPALDLLFRRAVEVGKRIRTETSIGRGTASVGHAAVELAEQRLGGLAGRRVAVLGAGDIGATVAGALAARGVADLAVVNRGEARGRRAGRCRRRPVGVPRRAGRRAVGGRCTGDGGGCQRRGGRARAGRAGVGRSRRAGPWWWSTPACPATWRPRPPTLHGVTLLDLDDLKRFAEAGRHERQRAAEAARELVEEAVARFQSERAARRADPVVASLRAWAEELRLAEVERYRGRLAGLTDRELAGGRGTRPARCWASCCTGRRSASRRRPTHLKGSRLADAAAELFRLEP